MLDDLHLTAGTLADILVFARSSPSLDELLVFFTAGASMVVHADEIEVRQGEPGPGAPDAHDRAGRAHVSRHPVWCGPAEWGELRLTYVDAAPTVREVNAGRLLAELLGAALVTAGVETGAPAVTVRHPAVTDEVGRTAPEDLVALVLHCAEALDLMTEASTRARLAVVVGRLAEGVGATSWSVGLRHDRMLYEVACAGDRVADDVRLGGSEHAAECELTDFPARLRASEGGGFYADRGTGDTAERRALGVDDAAVIGAGGYDLDGRSWVVTVRSSSAGRLEPVTPVLFALVLAALSFPREAAVPRPQDPWMREILARSRRGDPEDEVRGIGAAG